MRTTYRVLVAALAFGLFGAGPAAAQDKPVVGLVMKSLANEFFKSMEEGARKFAAEDGTFTLVPVGMNSETDIDTQINAVENFITQKVDVICLAPPTPSAWSPRPPRPSRRASPWSTST